MSMDWFDRVCEELQDHLESICDQYGEVGQMTIVRAAKHPRIEFFLETEEDLREYFFTLFYDPHNEEFYITTVDFDTDQLSKTILPDIEDIIDEVHETFHDFLDDGEWEEEEDDEDITEEIEVEWKTGEVVAYTNEDDVEVLYQFGLIEETGDGIIRRVNRFETADRELVEDESYFIFSQEEAITLISLIASHMGSLKKFDF
ncbi:hypothetical protein [Sporosarcina sp. Te-1]|uniref:hypothetical protein n=1 Tax=Sporosarcina sp. Te-1 TaxID=2818390 RepID=UPI001A9EF217|nr:hypothetical protein [Sporosarcina sp. Te-1]QTD42090.1 hypothetical protein J3U78_04455 [Sporosarcina sp. Te-1]